MICIVIDCNVWTWKIVIKKKMEKIVNKGLKKCLRLNMVIQHFEFFYSSTVLPQAFNAMYLIYHFHPFGQVFKGLLLGDVIDQHYPLGPSVVGRCDAVEPLLASRVPAADIRMQSASRGVETVQSTWGNGPHG
jgi:hypothetical protein